MTRYALATLILLAGCGDDGENPFASGTSGPTTTSTAPPTSSTGEATGSSGLDDTTSSTSDTGSSSGTDSSSVLDVGFDTEITATEGDMGCEKIDFLFIIDDSGSMRDEQEALIAAFPGFIGAIRREVQGTDHHIMVIDSDENPAHLCEEFLEGAHCDGSNLQPDCSGYECGSIEALDDCSRTLGAGVTHPVGGGASNMDCNFPQGRRYLTSEDDDLDAKFACAARVGVTGNGNEFPVSAAVEAVSEQLGQAGECNEGFLRNDAILVVTLVSDDPEDLMFAPDDDASSGDPQAWYDALVAAKGGDAQALAVIGIIPFGDTSCLFGDAETPNFVDFVQLFGDRGFPASICEDMVGIFASTIALIDTTCDEFTPAG